MRQEIRKLVEIRPTCGETRLVFKTVCMNNVAPTLFKAYHCDTVWNLKDISLVYRPKSHGLLSRLLLLSTWAL